ncbi:NrtA/SsuA/CpmA family ABC transporter substrate-binding protein [Amycolatopsis sp. EV170708-02-1]|uniref:NrtA/SsuA/CpmA family ABC transporter substrate-binding protein n=1 Tax=Amycolatopsis sp. EV170708-02-1 TaxID=2919322 RepID=UPI001F0CAE02|nr:NrtA/SsuA/CpmA family ABC transporter substrate-binding protein [Amycolatopsis sp. EV170708-02-1]UMP07043.1 NrtA/SsuA/CpmA family ABC transporter substrate-binding protein [Amycolatopsis sp. EV170708-02-1]
MPRTPLSSTPGLAGFTLAMASLLALTAAGCGTGADAGVAGDASFVLKVTDPGNAGPLAVGKRDGTFDKALAPLGARVEWVESTPGFSSNLKLFNTGRLDVSGGAYSPVVGALSKDVGVRIIAVADPVGKDRNGILASPASGIRSVPDLVGKRIAVNPAGKGEYITLKALAQAGIPADRVERVPLQQADATSAFATGKVDAWASFNEPYQEAKAKGAVEIATEESIGSVDNTIVAFRTAVLEERPDVAAKYLETLQELTKQQRTDPAAFENVFEKAGPRALSGARLDRALALGAEAAVPRYPTPQDAEDLDSVAGLFFQHRVTLREITSADVFYDLPGKLAQHKASGK